MNLLFTRNSVFFPLAALVVAACAGPAELGPGEGTRESAQGEDMLVTFPAASYSGAARVAYGATSSRPFVPADGYVAVKFVPRHKAFS